MYRDRPKAKKRPKFFFWMIRMPEKIPMMIQTNDLNQMFRSSLVTIASISIWVLLPMPASSFMKSGISATSLEKSLMP